jgi:DNA-binding NtrC family response regulator
MVGLFDLVERLGASELTVLIGGETGVGKDLIAFALHQWSGRRAGPFVTLNCAALPEALIESELFGHERGAFSGAVASKIGLLEAAAGGTVFLDEVGDLSAAAQSKLLRAIETRRVTRVGDVRERPLDIRVVAASNCDLKAAAAAGRFRSDLYFRLGAATVWVPPLRDRTSELPLLASAFLEEACASLGRPFMGISPAALACLAEHTWPGNVRELRNAMEYVAATVPDEVLQPWHLTRVDENGDGALAVAKVDEVPHPEPPAFRPVAEELRDLERLRMSQALAAAGGNQSHAARLIQMPARTFTYKLRQYKLTPTACGPRASRK